MNRHNGKAFLSVLTALLMLSAFVPVLADSGYVFANGNARAYIDADLTREYGVIESDSVMYLLSTAFNGEGRSVSQVMFGVNYILRTAWVDSRYVRGLTSEELDAYAARSRDGILYGSGVRLLNVGFTETKATASPADGFVRVGETALPSVQETPAAQPEAAVQPAATAEPATGSLAVGLNFHFDDNYVRNGQTGTTAVPAPAETVPANAFVPGDGGEKEGAVPEEPGKIDVPASFFQAEATPLPDAAGEETQSGAAPAVTAPVPAAGPDAFAVAEDEEEPFPGNAAAANGQEAPAGVLPEVPAGSAQTVEALGVYSGEAVFNGSEQWEKWSEFEGAAEFVAAATFMIDRSVLCDLYPVTDDVSVLPRIHLSGDNIVRVVLPAEMGIQDVGAFRAYLADHPIRILYLAREGGETGLWYLPLAVKGGGAERVLVAGPLYQSDLSSAISLIETCDMNTALQSFVALEWLSEDQVRGLND